MTLIEAFEHNKVEGFSTPDHKIDSLISRLFFFGNKVCKIYKYDKAFFGDFESFEFRRSFYERDFEWNHIFAPEIYLSLKGVKIIDGNFVHIDLEQAEDFYIEMNKIDASKNMLHLLEKGEVTETHLTEVTEKLLLRTEQLTLHTKDSLDSLYKSNWDELLKNDFEDLRSWAHMAKKYIPKQTTDYIVNGLIQAAANDAYMKNYNSANLAASIDNHAGNILIINDQVSFMDVLPPKETWLVGDIIFTLTRPVTDVAVLWGREQANLMYKIYERQSGQLPISFIRICEIRAALIQASYLYLLGNNTSAEKYMLFIGDQMISLEK